MSIHFRLPLAKISHRHFKGAVIQTPTHFGISAQAAEDTLKFMKGEWRHPTRRERLIEALLSASIGEKLDAEIYTKLRNFDPLNILFPDGDMDIITRDFLNGCFFKGEKVAGNTPYYLETRNYDSQLASLQPDIVISVAGIALKMPAFS